MNKNYPPGFKYPDFGREFKAEFYDPNKWLDIFNSSGAKYLVFVTKHHEGYSLWPSAHSWNWYRIPLFTFKIFKFSYFLLKE